jgi:hypothetical protein
LWLGGVASGLLAAGLISAVATVQSSRSLPFETWARDDLMHLMPGATSTNAMVAPQLAGAPERARMVGPTLPDHQPGEVDAALGSHARLEWSDIVIAGLGPILASAAAAERLATDLRLPRYQCPRPRLGPMPGAWCMNNPGQSSNRCWSRCRAANWTSRRVYRRGHNAFRSRLIVVGPSRSPRPPRVDDRRDMAARTPRAVRGRLVACLEHGGGD